MKIKHVFRKRKLRKCPIFSWRLNQNFWGYLWRTSNGSLLKPHITRIRNLKISPFFLLSSEKSMQRKHVFSQPKRRKWPIFSWRWNSIFWGYLWRTSDGSYPEPHKTRHRK
jgi:hypothetical protein